MSRTVRHRLLLVATLVAAFMLSAVPASADAPGPTHYQSTVTAVETADGEPFDDVQLDIIGGDSYLVIDVPEGTVAEVPGYEGEPYIRVEADGTVQVNERSPARWLNDERYGDTQIPPSADEDAPPTWVESAYNGQYAWHDHRIHYMSPSLPSQVDPDAGTPQDVFEWEISLLVDGESVVVSGDLVWLPGGSPAVPYGALAFAIALVAFGVFAKPSLSTWAILAGSAATGAAGAAMQLALPDGSDAEPAVIVLPAMALVALIGGLILLRRGDHRGAWLRDAAALPIGIWGVLQIGALTRPILPPPLPETLTRVVVVGALAIGAAVVAALIRRILQDTKLGSDDAPDVAASKDNNTVGRANATGRTRPGGSSDGPSAAPA